MKKIYYTIGEVSRITGVQPHILRYWESLFQQLSPTRSRAGKRVYKEKDINTVLQLKELIQDRKYSTAGAKKELKKQSKSDHEQPVRAALPADVVRDLRRIRLFLNDLLQKI